MSGRAYVGTSGFAYEEWKGGFYPTGLKRADMLSSYASRLSSVEINYTFNRFPTEALLAGWVAKTPPSFSFALKAPRRITHELRFNEADEPVLRFVTAARTLEARLGPILFQTPPNFAASPERLSSLLAALPPDVHAAFEFRHPSWDTEEVWGLLSDAGAAWCASDTDETPAVVHRTSKTHAYLRLRAESYDEAALASWTASISAMVAEGLDVHCYFRHTDDGRGATYALTVLERLGKQGAEPVEDLAGGRELDGGETDGAGALDVDVQIVDERGPAG